MTRAERLLAIMQSMRRRRGATTAAALAEEHDVSERTIYRDITTLAQRGALIEGSAGVGYVLRPGHFLPPLMLTADEADAIKLGLRYVMRRGDPDLVAAARDADAKISAVVANEVATYPAANGLVVAPAAGARPDLIGIIRQSIATEQKLAIDYVRQDGARASRLIWPVALGFFDDGEMLGAWCERRSAFRHFRLDRMHRCEAQADRFPVPHRLLIADYRRQEPGVQD